MFSTRHQVRSAPFEENGYNCSQVLSLYDKTTFAIFFEAQLFAIFPYSMLFVKEWRWNFTFT